MNRNRESEFFAHSSGAEFKIFAPRTDIKEINRSRGAEIRCIKARFPPIPLKNPLLWRRRSAFGAAVSEAKPGRSASGGEDRRRGDELREFPQILGRSSQ